MLEIPPDAILTFADHDHASLVLEGSELSITCTHARPAGEVIPAIERKILLNGTVVASGPDSQELTYATGQVNVTLNGSEVTCLLTNVMGSSNASETLRVIGGFLS